jgi:hypothetical protein
VPLISVCANKPVVNDAIPSAAKLCPRPNARSDAA